MTELSRLEVLTLIDKGIDNSVSIAAYYGDVKLRNRVGVMMRNLCRHKYIHVVRTSKGIAGSPINHYAITKPAKKGRPVIGATPKLPKSPFSALVNFRKEDMLCKLRSA